MHPIIFHFSSLFCRRRQIVVKVIGHSFVHDRRMCKHRVRIISLETKVRGGRSRGTPCTRCTDQGMGTIERRGLGWQMVDKMQELALIKGNPQVWKRPEQRQMSLIFCRKIEVGFVYLFSYDRLNVSVFGAPSKKHI